MLLLLWLLLAITAAAEPLTLKQAVARAMENSPELRVSLAQQEKAHQAYREARAQFIPNLVAGSGLAATRGFPLSIEGAAPSLFQVSSTSLILNLPQKHAIAESRQMWRAAESAGAARREEVVWKTAAAYLELNKVQRSMEFARREVESAARIEQAVAQRVREGREIPLELTRARLAGARQRQRVAALEGQAAVLETMLQGLTGIPATQSIETVDDSAPALHTPASVEAALQSALDSQQELKRLALEVAAREARLRSERAQRWPQFDLVAQYAVLSRANNYDRFFRDFERHNAQLGMALRFTVFDGKRLEARVGQAEAELITARAALAAARNDVTLEVSRLFRQVRQYEAAREVAKLELDLARESLSVALARFEEGRIASHDLEQARAEESARWIGFLDANFDLERARLDLLRQTGNLTAALR